MAQMVTIEGSMTPCAELPRGERRTVVYSDRVKRLVNRGFVVVIGEPRDIDAPSVAAGNFASGGVLPPQIAEGTGVPNIGHELPADGQMHDISLPGIEPSTPLAQVVPAVPQYPAEFAQPDPVHDPQAPTAESDTGG